MRLKQLSTLAQISHIDLLDVAHICTIMKSTRDQQLVKKLRHMGRDRLNAEASCKRGLIGVSR